MSDSSPHGPDPMGDVFATNLWLARTRNVSWQRFRCGLRVAETGRNGGLRRRRKSAPRGGLDITPKLPPNGRFLGIGQGPKNRVFDPKKADFGGFYRRSGEGVCKCPKQAHLASSQDWEKEGRPRTRITRSGWFGGVGERSPQWRFRRSVRNSRLASRARIPDPARPSNA